VIIKHDEDDDFKLVILGPGERAHNITTSSSYSVEHNNLTLAKLTKAWEAFEAQRKTKELSKLTIYTHPDAPTLYPAQWKKITDAFAQAGKAVGSLASSLIVFRHSSYMPTHLLLMHEVPIGADPINAGRFIAVNLVPEP